MITIKEVENLAKLARIKLPEGEKESLAKEIDAILGYVDQIKKATVDIDYTPTAGVIHNVFRDDVIEKSEARDAILKQAPDRVGDYIAVKKIIEQ